MEPSLLSPQLRRIAIQFCRDIPQVSSGEGDCANPKTDPVDCAGRPASHFGRRRRRRAADHRTHG